MVTTDPTTFKHEYVTLRITLRGYSVTGIIAWQKQNATINFAALLYFGLYTDINARRKILS